MESVASILASVSLSILRLVRDSVQYLGRMLCGILSFAQANVLDILTAIVLGGIATSLSIYRFCKFKFDVVAHIFDVWFGADTPRIIGENSAFGSPMAYRMSVHPLGGFRSLPFIMLHNLGFSAQQVSAAFVGLSAFVLVVSFYATARGLGLARFAAIVSTVLMSTTSAAMFWMVIPENFTLGAATLLIPLAWMTAKRTASDTVFAPLQSIISLSLFVTNWVAGLIAVLLALGPRAMLWSGTVAFAAVSALSVLQHHVFVHSGSFLNVFGERRFISPHHDSLYHHVTSLWSESFLAPNPFGQRDGLTEWAVAFAAHDWSSPVFLAAFAGWILLIGLSVAAIWRKAFTPRHLLFVVGMLVFQAMLFFVYGDGYFLYSLLMVPFAVILLSASMVGQYRTIAIVIAVWTACFTGYYNFSRLQEATSIYNQYEEKVFGPEHVSQVNLSAIPQDKSEKTSAFHIYFPSMPFARIVAENLKSLSIATDPGQYSADLFDSTDYVTDLAYAAVAMARTGDIADSKKVDSIIAQQSLSAAHPSISDLGSDIWAIEETSVAAQDPSFDHSVQRDIYRAAQRIARQNAGGSSIDVPTVAEQIPRAMFTTDMQLSPDWSQEPILSTKAFAWSGLANAAVFADRIGDHSFAGQLREQADGVLRQWRFEFRREALANPLTRTTLFWPTGVGNRDRDILSQHLHFPIDYGVENSAGLAIAEAHQFVRLEEPELAWAKLGHVLQPDFDVPEGVLGESPAALWLDYEGLKSPKTIPMSVRTQAEFTLFILESLAFGEMGENGPIVVVGAGLKADWLKKPITVSNLGTSDGVVDWSWDGRQLLKISTQDPAAHIELGSAFPQGTRIERLPSLGDGAGHS